MSELRTCDLPHIAAPFCIVVSNITGLEDW
jgi:hypothetical protein